MSTGRSSFGSGLQQRAIMSRSELREAIDYVLASGIEMSTDGEPNTSQLRKAASQLDRIMAIIDKYSNSR